MLVLLNSPTDHLTLRSTLMEAPSDTGRHPYTDASYVLGLINQGEIGLAVWEAKCLLLEHAETPRATAIHAKFWSAYALALALYGREPFGAQQRAEQADGFTPETMQFEFVRNEIMHLVARGDVHGAEWYLKELELYGGYDALDKNVMLPYATGLVHYAKHEYEKAFTDFENSLLSWLEIEDSHEDQRWIKLELMFWLYKAHLMTDHVSFKLSARGLKAPVIERQLIEEAPPARARIVKRATIGGALYLRASDAFNAWWCRFRAKHS